jgi:hypothetical protein
LHKNFTFAFLFSSESKKSEFHESTSLRCFASLRLSGAIKGGSHVYRATEEGYQIAVCLFEYFILDSSSTAIYHRIHNSFIFLLLLGEVRRFTPFSFVIPAECQNTKAALRCLSFRLLF